VAGTWQHTTVLLNEAVDALLADASSKPVPTYVDATFGRGGHSRLILSRLPAQGRLIAFDKDPDAIAEAAKITDPRFSIRHEGFRSLGDLPDASVAGVLLDLGVSSPQIDNPARGFSFRSDGPLDMRMDPTRGQSAADWLATAPVEQMAEVIRDYGEERFAFQVAKAIAARRQERGPLATTSELADLVARTVKTREPGQDPATRTFQALRIFVNAELEELQAALEDRIVKQFIAKHSRDEVDRRAPMAAPKPMKLNALGRVKPSAAEVQANPRSRSAVMRVAERTQV
jgi:16S rRNA (cytosine1402-N4)-methyltransferase